MHEPQDDKARLKELIVTDKVYEAGLLARKMAGAAAGAMHPLLKHKEPRVRRNVIEVAGELGGVENARLILAGLDDGDGEVRSLAALFVDVCAHKELLPSLLSVMEKQSDQMLLGSLALQVGTLGGREQIPALKEFGKKVSDPEQSRYFSLAKAKLGDGEARDELVRRFTHPDAPVRFQALRDCLYVLDKTLAAEFGPALEDYRDVIKLTLPESREQVSARVCDAAVYVMKNLGYAFSFRVDSLWVRKESELKEARGVVAAMAPRK